MKKLFLSLALVYIIAIQLSYQQTFKPQHQTTGPYGRSSGRRFNLTIDDGMFNTLPGGIIVSYGSIGIHSVSLTYMQQIGQINKTGGRTYGAITEIDLSINKIVGAEVCTGRRSGSSIIAGLKFTYDNGMVTYLHGNTNSVSNFTCTDATPKTSGYYLQTLTGRYGDYINQIRFYWVSDFKEEQACNDDPNCLEEVDFCESYCCYQKTKDANGNWENSALCA